MIGASPVKRRRWACAHANAELVTIETYSGYASTVGDPAGAKHDFRFDVRDEDLGAAVIDCLAQSRFLDTTELRLELYDYEAGKRNYAAWVEGLMQFGGYKTRRALFKHMMSVSIEQQDDILSFTPSHHEKLEGWSGAGFTPADNVVISAIESPAAIGAALREALRRCT